MPGRRDRDTRHVELHDVSFITIRTDQHELLGTIGDAYRVKYARCGVTYLQPMLAEQAVAATVRLDPRK